MGYGLRGREQTTRSRGLAYWDLMMSEYWPWRDAVVGRWSNAFEEVLGQSQSSTLRWQGIGNIHILRFYEDSFSMLGLTNDPKLNNPLLPLIAKEHFSGQFSVDSFLSFHQRSPIGRGNFRRVANYFASLLDLYSLKRTRRKYKLV